MATCSVVKPDGTQCKGPAMASGLCFGHSPRKAQAPEPSKVTSTFIPADQSDLYASQGVRVKREAKPVVEDVGEELERRAEAILPDPERVDATVVHQTREAAEDVGEELERRARAILPEPERVDTVTVPLTREAAAESIADQKAVRKRIDAVKNERFEAEKARQAILRERMNNPELRRSTPPPAPVFQRDTGVDHSIMIDHDGRPAGTPGYHKRHVRTVNTQDRTSSERARDMHLSGYRPIVSRVTGKQLAGNYGLWMECPPEAEAERVAALESLVSSKVHATESAAVADLNGYRGVHVRIAHTEDDTDY